MKNDLSNEKNLVLICSQLHNSINQTELAEIMQRPVNWQLVIQYASNNKVLALLYNNLVLSNYMHTIPECLTDLLDDMCSCNIIRNNEKLAEMKLIQEKMYQAGIQFAPVKGGYLIDNLYKNRAIRTTNDIDALIKRADISKVDEVMKMNGYQYGEADRETREVFEPSQTKKMLYKTKMYNLLPYVKFGSNVPNNAIMFDLSFALDFDLNFTVVNEMLDSGFVIDKTLQLKPEHYLLHLCSHHYREASHTEWIKIGKDLTLMKFCDVREFIKNNMDTKSLMNTVEFAKKHNCQRAVYFTLFFLREIYNDGYESDLLSLLDIDDESFLYQFGANEYDTAQTRKKDFWSSLFSDTNEDELTMTPKYEQLM